MIYKIKIQHTTDFKNGCNTLIIGASEIGKAVELALCIARSNKWKEPIVVESKEMSHNASTV